MLGVFIVFESIGVGEQLVCWFSRLHDLPDETLRVVPLNEFFFGKHLDLFGLLFASLLLNEVLDFSFIKSEFDNIIDSTVVIPSGFQVS